MKPHNYDDSGPYRDVCAHREARVGCGAPETHPWHGHNREKHNKIDPVPPQRPTEFCICGRGPMTSQGVKAHVTLRNKNGIGTHKWIVHPL